jgi:CheY-like chemotaxis protein
VAKESAEAGDRAKEEFLAVMSHEIRTPMQSVLGYSELLAHSDLGIAQREYLDAIRSQGRTLLRIVQDILDFSILRKSSYTLKRETVFLPRLVESAFETIQPLAARKDLRTSLSIAEDVPEVVLGDAVRIEQILLNLLGNAVKFTDQGAIRASVEVDKRGSNPDRTVEWVVFTIADSGMGIRKDEIRRLFEPFARAPDAESKPREGAGLGLAIVKRLCQLMGGRVEIESEYGKGTRFFVRLPFVTVTGPVDATAFAEQGMSAASREAGMGRLGTVVPLRFLVADDNPYIRLLMIEYLHSIGYDPVAVDSGGQAAARWREFDFLILDLRMPGMDGVTAAQKIREESKNAVVPWIVGVSATLAEAEIERAMRAGMNDFLGKPFFVQSLVEAIEASPIYVERLGRHEVDADADDSEAGRGVHVVTPSPGGADPADPQGGVEIVAVAGEAPEAAETKIVPEPAVEVPMSWMPDLTANGTSAIVEQAVAEIPGLLDEIGSALQKRQFEVASDRAHYLKNTILALRIDVMNGPGRELNERAAAGDAPLAIEHLDTLRQNFAAWMVERETKQTRRPRPD